MSENNVEAKSELSLQLESEEQEYRAKATGLGLNPDNVIFGCVIDHILGDDANSFNYGLSLSLPGGERATRDPDLLESAKKKMLDRMDWERDHPFLPPDLKEKLNLTREKMAGYDWTNKEEFDQAYDYWRKNMLDWLFERSPREKDKKGDPKYQAALKDFQFVYYGAPLGKPSVK